MRLELLRRLQRQLNLAPEQEQQINSILSQSQERHRKIVEPLAPQLQEELHRATAEFRAVLTSEQRELFDNLASQTRGRGKPARSRLPAP